MELNLRLAFQLEFKRGRDGIMKTKPVFIPICILLVAALLSIGACGDEETGWIEGIVEFVEVEGGCWQIEGNDGVSYEPINLPLEFQEHGLAVLFSAKHRGDLASTCMVGKIVEILEIRMVNSG
jgi:hypothetical protein